jgi:hypothetical protein
MSRAEDHSHEAPGGPDDGADAVAFDWFRALDLAVWAAVVVIGALALEWVIGTITRERVARGADRLLAKARAASSGTEQT